jgi:protein-S-isoprenylcysteine O-methyltransferase Ste14
VIQHLEYRELGQAQTLPCELGPYALFDRLIRACDGDDQLQCRRPIVFGARFGLLVSPVVANFSAFGLFFAALVMFSRSSEAFLALPLAVSGCLLALAGAALVLRSRAELGSAWSLVPRASQSLVTTGPYRLVRHPIYLGLVLVAVGEALAFGCLPALLIVLSAILPTFVWRARAEETLLSRTLSQHYTVYRQRTKMIIPHVL